MHFFTKQKNIIGLLSLLFLVATMIEQRAFAQCATPAAGCSNTDLTNFGYQSNNNAANIEYDSFVSAYHQSVGRTANGSFRVLGDNMAANATSAQLSLLDINATNFPDLTGALLKVTISLATTYAIGATLTGGSVDVTGTWVPNILSISGTPTVPASNTNTVAVSGSASAAVTAVCCVSETTSNQLSR